MQREHSIVAGLALAALVGCESGGEETSSEVSAGDGVNLTYYGQTKSIIDRRCATCHQPGEIGPFSLTTYDEVRTFAGPVRASIENGTMPPWMPSDECNTYLEDIDLTADEETTLLAWLNAGAPAGDPADAPADSGEEEAPTFEVDYALQLPEAYTPVLEPDDYRCQLIPWPADEVQFVTGLRVQPDQRSIVHHVIVFLARPEQVATYQAYDEAEEGPGYTCYGGPGASDGGVSDLDPATILEALQKIGVSLADLRSGNLTDEQRDAVLEAVGGGMVGGFETVGSWVPGIPNAPFPAGTGIRIEPGSMLVAQVHYNTSSAVPVADQSTIELSVAASVERQATGLGVVDMGWITNGMIGDPMTIPAGEADVRHSTTVAFDDALVMRARQVLGLANDAPLVVHSANHHMHELGTTQRAELRHDDGSTTCLLDIPDWDFDWQGAYTLTESVPFRPGDQLWMGCSWDNTAANQPIIDGQAREPVDVSWGEGTTDEMCLGSYYVTAE